MAKKPSGPRRVNVLMSGEHVRDLNLVSPGLGNAIQLALSALGQGQDALSGHKGTVSFPLQTKTDARGVPVPIFDTRNQRVAGVADPKDDLDAVNLKTLRRTVKKGIDVAAVEAVATKAKPACDVYKLQQRGTLATNYTKLVGVRVIGDYAFIVVRTTP